MCDWPSSDSFNPEKSGIGTPQNEFENCDEEKTLLCRKSKLVDPIASLTD
jgi:hypothetical protein